jgi:hypothetical protein
LVNSGLAALGLFIIVGMFIFTNILVSPQEKAQIGLTNQACGSIFGQIGSAISGQVAEGCQNVQTYSSIASLSTPAYFIGFILLIAGLVTGGRKKTIKEVIKEIPSGKNLTKEVEEEEESEEPEEEIEEIEEKPKVKFCASCGTKVKGNFCTKCGEEL